MKKLGYTLLVALCGTLSACSSDDPSSTPETKVDELPAKGTTFANFETDNTTPYVFRYGNNVTDYKTYDYYPRWAYSHTVVDNPVKNTDNSSSKVLEYTSMEARNYGLKFRFTDAMSVDRLKGVRFQIYQPANVIGKDTWKGTSKATTQKITIKLMGRYNAVNDFEQEEGVLLSNEAVDFQETGTWKTFTFAFSKDKYSSASTQLSSGIVGIAILPTFNSNVTLSEDNTYKCYIDNIEIL